MKPFRFTLTFHILASLSALLVLTWILLSLISFKTAENDLYLMKGEEGKSLLASVGDLLPRPLTAPPPGSAADRYLAQLTKWKGYAGLLVVRDNGETVVSIKDKRGGDPQLYSVLLGGRPGFQVSRDGRYGRCYAPITDGGQIVGAGRLTFSLATEQQRLKEQRQLLLTYFTLDFLLLLLFGSYLLSRSVVVPIRRLLSATGRIAAGDLQGTVNVRGSTEVAELSNAFNLMVMALREKQEEVEEKVASLNRANAELREARNETVRSEKMASVGLLAAGMAHEIGTPLAAVMGYTDILADELSSDEEKSDYLRRIGEETRRIDRIVRGLLDFSRPRPAVREEVEVRSLFENIVELLGTQGVLKQLEVRIEAGAALPDIRADRHQLEQLLINLIMNARDAMPQGGTLSLIGRSDGDEVLMEVRDTGMGMPPEHLPLVFDPFFTTKEPGKGTGLGLAIAARIAESCGGRITVQSEVGKGSSFVLRIPHI